MNAAGPEAAPSRARTLLPDVSIYFIGLPAVIFGCAWLSVRYQSWLPVIPMALYIAWTFALSVEPPKTDSPAEQSVPPAT